MILLVPQTSEMPLFPGFVNHVVYEKPLSLNQLQIQPLDFSRIVDSTWSYIIPGELISQRCKLHLDEDPHDAGHIQKRMKLWAQYYLPVSDIVNSSKAGFANAPCWYEVLSTNHYTSLAHSKLPLRARIMGEMIVQLLELMTLIFLQVKFLKDGILGSRFPKLSQWWER